MRIGDRFVVARLRRLQQAERLARMRQRVIERIAVFALRGSDAEQHPRPHVVRHAGFSVGGERRLQHLPAAFAVADIAIKPAEQRADVAADGGVRDDVAIELLFADLEQLMRGDRRAFVLVRIDLRENIREKLPHGVRALRLRARDVRLLQADAAAAMQTATTSTVAATAYRLRAANLRRRYHALSRRIEMGRPSR